MSSKGSDFSGHDLINEDLDTIKQLIEYSEDTIRNEMNFVKFYEQELKQLEKIEFRCFKGENSLYKLILSVYANYEFTIKSMFEYVLEIIDKEKVSFTDLNINIRALFFKENVNDLRKELDTKNSEEKKAGISEKIIKLYESLEKKEFFTTNGNMISTRSNLKINVLEEIIYYFDIQKELLKPYESYIKSLVHYRNNIAHGNIAFADKLPRGIRPINTENYEILCEKIIEMTKKIFIQISMYIVEKKYLK